MRLPRDLDLLSFWAKGTSVHLLRRPLPKTRAPLDLSRCAVALQATPTLSLLHVAVCPGPGAPAPVVLSKECSQTEATAQPVAKTKRV